MPSTVHWKTGSLYGGISDHLFAFEREWNRNYVLVSLQRPVQVLDPSIQLNVACGKILDKCR